MGLKQESVEYKRQIESYTCKINSLEGTVSTSSHPPFLLSSSHL